MLLLLMLFPRWIIVSLPLAFLLGCLPESLADIHILQDTVWNSNRNITDVVVVFPDVTLRIQGNRTFGLSPSSNLFWFISFLGMAASSESSYIPTLPLLSTMLY